MRTMILRVIAEPSQIFFAPLLPAAANILLNVTAMLFGIILIDLTPVIFFVTALVGHVAIAGYALREPHLSTLLSAWMEQRRKTRNLLRVKGNKYAC